VPNSCLCKITTIESNPIYRWQKDAFSLTYCRKHTETHTHTHSLSLSTSLSHRRIHTYPHKSHRQGGLVLEHSVPRQLLIANSRERPRSVPCKVAGGRSGKRNVLIRLFRVSLLIKIPRNFHTNFLLSTFLRGTIGWILGISIQSSDLSDIGKHWIDKIFSYSDTLKFKMLLSHSNLPQACASLLAILCRTDSVNARMRTSVTLV